MQTREKCLSMSLFRNVALDLTQRNAAYSDLLHTQSFTTWGVVHYTFFWPIDSKFPSLVYNFCCTNKKTIFLILIFKSKLRTKFFLVNPHVGVKSRRIKVPITVTKNSKKIKIERKWKIFNKKKILTKSQKRYIFVTRIFFFLFVLLFFL